MRRIAELEHKYRGSCLYFRGQSQDWGFDSNTKSPSTLLPSIYRRKGGGARSTKDVIASFDRLQCMDGIVLREFAKGQSGRSTSEHAKQWQRALVRWSVIQHYELLPDHGTPLLDVTQSLDVACAFACRTSRSATAQPGTTAPNHVERTLYVLALPYPSAGISTHPEEAITNVRLLSVCPPKAKRPRYQAGFAVLPELIEPDLAGLALEAGDAGEMDFSLRLIGKFQLDLPNSEVDRLQAATATLFPTDDEIVEKTLTLQMDGTAQYQRFRQPLDLIAQLLGCVLDLRKRWLLVRGTQTAADRSKHALPVLLRTVREFDPDHRSPRWIEGGHAAVVARALRFRSEVIAYWRTGDRGYEPYFEHHVAEQEIGRALETLNAALRRLQARLDDYAVRSRHAA